MPTYDYHCDANGRTLAVRHPMAEAVSTWGELCARAAADPGDTAPDTPVHKILTASAVVSSASLGSGCEPMGGGCGMGPCGGGMCQYQ